MRRREWLIAAAGLLAGLLLLLLWLAPRVVDRRPADLVLPAGQPIALELNRDIRPESVPGRFHIEPEVDGRLSVQGGQIIFEPAAGLAYGQRYTVSLEAGISGANRLPLLRGAQWSIDVRPPRLLYLLEEDGASDLWLVEEDGRARRLTSEPFGVWDYAPLADGSGVVYSALNGDGGLDLALLTAAGQRQTLIECDAGTCRSPDPQPAGRLVAYERQRSGAGLDAAELWLLDLDSLETRPAPVPGDLISAGFEAPLGRHPRWSPDGRFLAAYRPDANLIVIQDLSGAGSEPLTIPANLESMAGWSPDGRRLAYTELALGQSEPHDHVDEAGTVISHTGTALYSHAVIADIDELTATDLSAGLEIDESRPAWHPGGDMLAVARTETGSGRQLWLVPLAGGEATQLTDDPFYDHSALAWSPDGRHLAYMRAPQAGVSSSPTVMLLDLESGQTRPIAEAGFIPAWWP